MTQNDIDREADRLALEALIIIGSGGVGGLVVGGVIAGVVAMSLCMLIAVLWTTVHVHLDPEDRFGWETLHDPK